MVQGPGCLSLLATKITHHWVSNRSGITPCPIVHTSMKRNNGHPSHVLASLVARDSDLFFNYNNYKNQLI